MIKKIISGGQTGVDQAALRAAMILGLDYGGWCPTNKRSEDGPIPTHFKLTPTPQERSADAPDIPRSMRTEWNIRDSQGSLVLNPVEHSDPGTSWALQCAETYDKPVMILSTDDPEAEQKLMDWLQKHNIKELSVGGPSEKTSPGVGDKVFEFLVKVLKVASG